MYLKVVLKYCKTCRAYLSTKNLGEGDHEIEDFTSRKNKKF